MIMEFLKVEGIYDLKDEQWEKIVYHGKKETAEEVQMITGSL